ncbi:MAG: LytR C-terminal domain-containing protein [Lachnospiraceae bacterium]|nr:LytR C-terminal domain-containing protein [Lachnospiraceae bacterium]
MKNGKSILKIFGINLLKSLLSICLLIAVGCVSYLISYHFLSKQAAQQKKQVEQDTLEEIKHEAQVDEVSKNLIYVSDEKNKITNMILEICNTKTNNMDYVTIPTKTDYTIPTTMYRKLCTINDEIPQIIRLSRIKQYFENEDDAYGYGLLIVQKMLGTKLSYYTVLTTENYQSFCQETKVKVSYKKTEDPNASPSPSPTPSPTVDPETGKAPKQKKTSTNTKTKMNISIASTEFTTKLNDIKGNQEKIAEYIQGLYDIINSNLTVYNKLGYLDCYEKMDVALFHYWGIPGEYNTDKVFEVDTKAAKSFLKKLIANPTYTEVQDLTTTQKADTASSPEPTAETGKKKKKSTKAISSKGANITILNGSRINGLAGKMKEKLQEKGYTIGEIGDYTKETLTKTKIIVKKEGQGEDLAKYFKDPTVTVGMVDDGYDIEIIVGTADAN